MSAFEDIGAVGPLRIWDDVVAREVHGRQTTLAVVELEPGALVPEHHHVSEQLGMVIEGSVSFRVADERGSSAPGEPGTSPPTSRMRSGLARRAPSRSTSSRRRGKTTGAASSARPRARPSGLPKADLAPAVAGPGRRSQNHQPPRGAVVIQQAALRNERIALFERKFVD